MTTPRYCVSCGSELEAEARFCRTCGTAVVIVEPSPDVCSNCGVGLQAGTKFCTSCGTPVGATTSAAAQPKANVLQSRTALVAGGVVAALVVVVIALTTLGGSDDAAQAPVSSEVTTQLNSALAGLPPVEGETDLEQMRSLLGPPDAFTLALEVTEDGGQARREEWYYFDLLSVYEFSDETLVSNLPLGESTGLLAIPAQYDPANFTLALTWDEVSVNLTNPDAFASYELEDELGIEGNYYVGEQLLLVFDDSGLLVYVEALPLEAEAIQ